MANCGVSNSPGNWRGFPAVIAASAVHFETVRVVAVNLIGMTVGTAFVHLKPIF